MVDPDDLLGKADALMARHRPQLGAADTAPEIPVLDEVVDVPVAQDLPLLTECVVAAPFDEEQARTLAASLRSALLAELQTEVDALIEERLQPAIAGLVERMANELRDELKLAAREILRDAVARAIEQEIDRRKGGD